MLCARFAVFVTQMSRWHNYDYVTVLRTVLAEILSMPLSLTRSISLSAQVCLPVSCCEMTSHMPIKGAWVVTVVLEWVHGPGHRTCQSKVSGRRQLSLNEYTVLVTGHANQRCLGGDSCPWMSTRSWSQWHANQRCLGGDSCPWMSTRSWSQDMPIKGAWAVTVVLEWVHGPGHSDMPIKGAWAVTVVLEWVHGAGHSDMPIKGAWAVTVVLEWVHGPGHRTCQS